MVTSDASTSSHQQEKKSAPPASAAAGPVRDREDDQHGAECAGGRAGIEPRIRFARRLRPYLPGILGHCRYPLGTNLVEGINNKIKVIKRMAYGFRDDACFFLEIRPAFPGVGR